MQKNRFLIIIFFLTICSSVVCGQVKKSPYRPHYDRALELITANQYPEAINQLNIAKKLLNPSDEKMLSEIDFRLIKSSYELNASQTIADCKNFLEKYTHSLHRNEISLILGECYYKNNDYSSALEYFTKFNDKALTYLQVQELYFKRGYCCLQLDQCEQATHWLGLVRTNSFCYPAAQYYLAYVDYISGRYDDALKGFTALSNDKKFSAVIPFYILQIKFLQGDYQYVIDKGEQVLDKATPERKAEICRIIAESFFNLKNYVKALDYIELYQDAKGTMGFAENYLKGYSHYMIGEWESAEQTLTKVAYTSDEIGQNSAFYLGATYLKLGDKRRAAMAFLMASKLDFNPLIKQEALFVGAKLQYEIGGDKFNETINAFTEYVTNYPQSDRNIEAREYLLSAYFNSRNYEAALESLAFIPNPDNNIKSALQKISYFRALEHFNNGDYDKAAEMFSTAIENPYNSKYTALSYFWKAETLFKQGQYDQALPRYQTYIRLAPKTEPEYGAAVYNSAYCNFSMQNMAAAAEDFDKFIAMNPDSKPMVADSYNRLGDINFLAQDYLKAEQNYSAAADIKVNQSDYANYQRAVIKGVTGDQNAKIDILHSITSAPKSDYTDDAMVELGNTYIRIDRFADGAEVLKDFVVNHPDSPLVPAALAKLGLTYQNMGNDDQALVYYKSVVKQYPTSPLAKDALIGIRNIYIDKNDIDTYVKFASTSGIETNITVTEKDSLTYTSAERVYLSSNFKEAEKSFASYIAEFPRGAFVSGATYFSADALKRLGDIKGALQYSEKLYAMPLNTYSERGFALNGDLNYATANYRRAAESYKRLSEVTKDNEIANNALIKYLDAYEKIDDNKSTIEASHYVLSAPQANENTKLRATFTLANAQKAMGDVDNALRNYRSVAAKSKYNGEQANYQVIQILFDQKKYDLAEKEIYAFSESRPSEQIWLGKAFLILGDIYSISGDNFQAKATFQSIVDGYSSKTDGIIDLAKQKIKALK